MTSKFHSRVTVGDSRADRPQTTYEALETEVGLAIYRVSPPGTRILAYFEARRSLDDDEGDEGE